MAADGIVGAVRECERRPGEGNVRTNKVTEFNLITVLSCLAPVQLIRILYQLLCLTWLESLSLEAVGRPDYCSLSVYAMTRQLVDESFVC